MCTEAADVALILDASGSMNDDGQRMKQVAKGIVEMLPIGEYNVRIALITYSNYAYINFTFDRLVVHYDLILAYILNAAIWLVEKKSHDQEY